MKDGVLITWAIISAVWDILVFGTAAYEIFQKDHSGWWFVFALLLTYNPSLYKALYKRFDITESE
jgi:hypothetical protein